MKKVYLIIAVFAFLGSAFAQELDGWKLNGQVQLRSEVDGRDFSNETHPLTFASLRTRLGVEKIFDKKLQFFVQFQDSRVFGEEGNPNTDLMNVDMHQGFLKLMKPFDWDINVQAGRFEVVYGTERFFGASNWGYTGRSYDGVRLSVLPECWDLDVFALTLNEEVNYIGGPSSTLYPYPHVETPSHSIYGFYKKNKLSDESKFDIVGYYEINREDVGLDTNRLNVFTFGGTYWGNYEDFSTTFEAAYQLGGRSGVDVGAYLLSLQGAYKVNIFSFGLGADLLSGNDPETADKHEGYFATYGTGHKFFGFMDYFPSNAAGLGTNDFYFKFAANPKESDFSFALDFHQFMTNQPVTITSVSDPVGTEENMLGQELDLTVKYNFVKNTSVSWGGSLFFPGELMKVFYAPREDSAFWTYLMITANL
ncbi:MAG: alginate export family protein [Ignavibacteriaceae bacterium]